MVRKALSIILAARRHLSLAEMNIAVNVTIDSKTDEDLDLESEQDFGKRLRSWCGLFISMLQDKVYFLHQTAREFLLQAEISSPVQPSLNNLQRWNRSITSEQADAILAVSCIVYLDRMMQQNIQCKDLLEYASEYWPSHYRGSGKDLEKRLLPFLARLCDPGDPEFTTWYTFRDTSNRMALENCNMLCVAAYLGIHSLVKHLIASNKDLDVDEKNDGGRTPLAAAATEGHEEAVKLFLETGKVDVNSSDWLGFTPLYYAIMMQHDAVIHLLLEAGKVDMNYKKFRGRTPLNYASSARNEAAVRLMLERYDDYLYVDSKDNRGRTALSIAAENGSEGIVHLLLDTGKVNEDFRCPKGRTPLSYASQGGFESVVRLLLATGKVDTDSMSAKRRTPLSYAAEFGKSKVIKLLLEMGKVNVDAKDNESRTPLLWASRKGQTEAVRLLLDLGKANPELLDDTDSTPLEVAIAFSHFEIIKLLKARQQLIV